MLIIEEIENDDVYDITNPENHNFFGNDILVHNCSEILLRDKQFCNLSEVVVRSTDTPKTLLRKIRLATILGTFQSTLTNFRFLSKKWKDNTEDERLLGVSLTGIMDNELMSGQKGPEKLKDVLTELRKQAIATNKEFADALGIPQSTAITAVKPSGTVSSLVDSSSGIHTRHAPYYIRTARSDKKDPLSQVMIDAGIYHEPDATKPDNMWVFYFPMKSPNNAITRDRLSAIEQLEIWLMYQMYYCEHKPSVTISVREDEWMEVGAWVFKNFEWMSGVSFLPYSDHVYVQAPFQDITKEQYDEWVAKTPSSINWNDLAKYEQSDQTVGAQTLACAAGGCDI